MSEMSDGADRIEEILRQILDSADDADKALAARDIAELRRIVSDIRTEAKALLIQQSALSERMRAVEVAAMEYIFGKS